MPNRLWDWDLNAELIFLVKFVENTVIIVNIAITLIIPREYRKKSIIGEIKVVEDNVLVSIDTNIGSAHPTEAKP